ncbi:hypothetical protein AB1207_17925 [Kineococcus endophyticus]|uniref:Uncharacterized protein n=1 Tax=Kineococcus endophyticus TaxID=1181883 RepID=A0ABV3PAH3_9ACTN
MRPVLVLPLAALVLTAAACGSQSAAPVAGASPSGSATSAPDASSAQEDADAARFEWLQGGPMATSMPSRTCTWHQPTDEELSTTAPDEHDGLYWTSCFDPTEYEGDSMCTPPADLPPDGTYACFVEPKLTQRVVDDWNQFVDTEDRASARRLGLSLQEYREQHPDQHADGSPVDPPS